MNGNAFMTTKLELVIIEDDSNKRADLKRILSFNGNDNQIISAKDWQSSPVSLTDNHVVMLGEVSDLVIAKQILSQCESNHSGIPVISFGVKDNFSFVEDNNSLLVGHLNWPFSSEELASVLYSCSLLQLSSLTTEDKKQAVQLRANMVGNSNVMESVRKLILQVAKSEASVLILGESGTGKEVAARNLHDLSNRNNKPFVPINCGAIPADLLESELFGHEKGAFTGALTTRKGRFELADGGTIFLDEIGDMPMPMQVKLLRVLQERTFEKVGSSTSIDADVRIIAATHRKLADEVKEGRFREDLFYRLNVFPINMPALRERVEDISQLAAVLVNRLEQQKRGSVRLSPNAIVSLTQCMWPGNVRELANLIERLCILHPYGIADVRDLPEEYRGNEVKNSYESPQNEQVQNRETEPNLVDPIGTKIPEDGLNLKDHIKELEVAFIKQALDEENWVVARAAKRLKMQRTTLVEKMRKYDLHKSE